MLISGRRSTGACSRSDTTPAISSPARPPASRSCASPSPRRNEAATGEPAEEAIEKRTDPVCGMARNHAVTPIDAYNAWEQVNLDSRENGHLGQVEERGQWTEQVLSAV